MTDEILVRLAQLFDKEVRLYEAQIGEGKATDYGDYKWKCGIIRGILLAKEQLINLSDEMKEDNDAE